MSSFDEDRDFNAELAQCIAKFRAFPDVTDTEALVMAACIVAPQTWQGYLARNHRIRMRRSKELLVSGVGHYHAGGGREYWTSH